MWPYTVTLRQRLGGKGKPTSAEMEVWARDIREAEKFAIMRAKDIMGWTGIVRVARIDGISRGNAAA